jgi:hypothetical protein
LIEFAFRVRKSPMICELHTKWTPSEHHPAPINPMSPGCVSECRSSLANFTQNFGFARSWSRSIDARRSASAADDNPM